MAMLLRVLLVQLYWQRRSVRSSFAGAYCANTQLNLGELKGKEVLSEAGRVFALVNLLSY